MKRYALNHEDKLFEIRSFKNPMDLLDHIEKSSRFDILILDICMPGILGTDIAKQIRAEGGQSEIIFLTTSQDYAVEAFAVKAVHYIIKPFSMEQFNEAIDRAVEKFIHKKSEAISIKTKNGQVVFIELSEIMYVECYHHIQIVYLKDGEVIEARETLIKLLSLFEEHAKGQFICPYKGFIVNQKKIKSIEVNQIVLKNGVNIPIVKRNFGAIKQQYFDYMFTREVE